MTPLRIASNLSDRRRDALLARVEGVALVPTPDGQPWAVPEGLTICITQQTDWAQAPQERPAGWPGALQWLHFVSAGVDDYPAWVFDVPNVTCGRHVNAVPIAEYALAALLEAEKRLAVAVPWEGANDPERRRGTLQAKVLGLVGFGAIGREVALRAAPFGMRILALRRSGAGASEDGVSFVEDAEALVSQADHVVICAPLTELTRNMFNPALLARCKPGLHLVNVARGGLIDEAALLAALNRGQIGRATLDVRLQEPPAPDDALAAHPAVLATPHVSWQGGDTDARLATRLAANIARWRRAEPLDDRVDAGAGY